MMQLKDIKLGMMLFPLPILLGLLPIETASSQRIKAVESTIETQIEKGVEPQLQPFAGTWRGTYQQSGKKAEVCFNVAPGGKELTSRGSKCGQGVSFAIRLVPSSSSSPLTCLDGYTLSSPIPIRRNQISLSRGETLIKFLAKGKAKVTHSPSRSCSVTFTAHRI